jgi:hypothetical protein
MAALVKSPTISKGWGGPLIFAKDHKTLDMFDPLARFGPHPKEKGNAYLIISKAIGLFMDCEKMVGGPFEKGLTQIKSIAEGATRQ